MNEISKAFLQEYSYISILSQWKASYFELKYLSNYSLLFKQLSWFGNELTSYRPINTCIMWSSKTKNHCYPKFPCWDSKMNNVSVSNTTLNHSYLVGHQLFLSIPSSKIHGQSAVKYYESHQTNFNAENSYTT